MTINQLYHTLMQQIEQINPTERITRKRVLAWMMTCLFLGRNLHAARLGNKIPSQAKKTSKAERLRRCLSNKAVRVRDWYEPIARQLIVQVQYPVSLYVSSLMAQMLMVAIAYRRRAVPLAWMWVRCRRGHSSTRKPLALLSYVHSLIPTGQLVQLVDDSKFGPFLVLKQPDAWFWQYVL